MNTYDLITALKAKYSLESDYQVHKFLKVNKQTVYNWRNGKQCDDDMALKLADLLNYNPQRVLLEVQGHRTNNPVIKETYLAYAETLPLEKGKKNNELSKAG